LKEILVEWLTSRAFNVEIIKNLEQLFVIRFGLYFFGKKSKPSHISAANAKKNHESVLQSPCFVVLKDQITGIKII
jgi:hypothetical protein